MGSPFDMQCIENSLREDGSDVLNWGYSSRSDFIENHGKSLATKLQEIAKVHPGNPIHFVAYSMGSLVLLAALNDPEVPEEAKIGRVVLISPPLGGSTLMKWLGQFSLPKIICKEYSGAELINKTNFFELLRNYPETIEKFLVIAGDFGYNPLLSEPNDGAILVRETILPFLHEHVIVHSHHSTITFSNEVTNLTRNFLNYAFN